MNLKPLFDDVTNRFLDSLEIFWSKGTLEREIVEETIFDHRTDSYLSCRE